MPAVLFLGRDGYILRGRKGYRAVGSKITPQFCNKPTAVRFLRCTLKHAVYLQQTHSRGVEVKHSIRSKMFSLQPTLKGTDLYANHSGLSRMSRKIDFKRQEILGDVISCGNILLNERTYFILQQCQIWNENFDGKWSRQIFKSHERDGHRVSSL